MFFYLSSEPILRQALILLLIDAVLDLVLGNLVTTLGREGTKSSSELFSISEKKKIILCHINISFQQLAFSDTEHGNKIIIKDHLVTDKLIAFVFIQLL